MVTMKYTTLKGLIAKSGQYSLNTFFNKRIHHINKGWVNVKLTDELNNKIEGLFCDFLNINSLNYHTYGLFDRLIIDKDLEIRYITGQDYPSEIRAIKRLLK